MLDLDKSVQLVKKLKLTGTPMKIFKNTAFVKVIPCNLLLGVFAWCCRISQGYWNKLMAVWKGITSVSKKYLLNELGIMLITYKHILLAKAANSKESSKPHNRMYHDLRGLLKEKAPPKTGTIFRLKVYNRIGFSWVEAYGRLKNSVISVFKRV